MGTRGFVVHRVDGSSTDFSYYSCITPPDNTALVRKAMRRTVTDRITEFKRASAARAPLGCAVTGEALSWDGAHVDHASPVFIALVAQRVEVSLVDDLGDSEAEGTVRFELVRRAGQRNESAGSVRDETGSEFGTLAPGSG